MTLEKSKTIEMLNKLAAAKGQQITLERVSFMAGDLTKQFTLDQIKMAISYFLRRSKWFPDLADFYDFLAPNQTPEVRAFNVWVDFMKKAIANAPRESYTAEQFDLFDLIKPQQVRDATNSGLFSLQKMGIEYLTHKFNTPEEKLKIHRLTIEHSKENELSLKESLTTLL